jgi:phosphoglycerate kinase
LVVFGRRCATSFTGIIQPKKAPLHLLMSKLQLTDLPDESLREALVVLRVDFNVPMGDDGGVSDDTRIRSCLPTLEYLRDRGSRVVVLSHFGRPGGEPRSELSLAPVARYVNDVVGFDIGFCVEAVGDCAHDAVHSLQAGDTLLLENTRFHPEEKANDVDWARSLSHGAVVFVNDAFGAAHRAHASTAGVAAAVKERGGVAVAGLLMARELTFLGGALADPERPFVAVLGGAKISGKIDVIEALLPRVDRLIVGGAMANTFLLAMGLEVGKSLVEEDRVDMSRDLIARAGERLMLPVDVVVGDSISPDARTHVVARTEIQAQDVVGDVGSESALLFANELGSARTILWNGPMGVFEVAAYAGGTMTVANAAAVAAEGGATVVLGGGDSAAAADRAGVSDRLTHISTGGGAALEFLAGRELPGIASLSNRVGRANDPRELSNQGTTE